MAPLRSTLLISLLFSCWPTFAADCAPPTVGETHYDALHRLYDTGCLGRDEDRGADAQEFRVQLNRLATSDDSPAGLREHWLAAAGSTIDGIKAHVLTAAKTAPQAVAADLTLLSEKLEAVRKVIVGSPDFASFSAKSGMGLVSDDWNFNFAQSRFLALDMPSVTPWLKDECSGPIKQECRLAYDAASTMLRAGGMMSTLMYFPGYVIASQQKEDLHRRNSEWRAYFEKARSQYWWELQVNSLRYDRRNKRDNLCGVTLDKVGSVCSAIGAFEPPHDQIIFLHPGAALEYVGGAPDGGQFKPAVVMEWGGYNRWLWKNDGSMGFALGASLISSYADRSGIKDIRHGFVLHVDHRYSLGVTFGSGKTGFFVSADLGKAIVDTDDKAHQAIRFGR